MRFVLLGLFVAAVVAFAGHQSRRPSQRRWAATVDRAGYISLDRVSRSAPVPLTVEPAPTTTSTTPTTIRATGCLRHGAKSQTEMRACWADLVGRYPWPVAKVWQVMWCESKGDPWARNATGAAGLMQVMGGPYSPEANIDLAYQMFHARGWQPWICA